MEFTRPTRTAPPPPGNGVGTSPAITKYDFLMNKLKQTRDAASRNVSRDSGCDERTVNGSARTSSDSGGRKSFCDDHSKRKDQYCLDDKILVCLKCLLYGLHKNHNSLDLEVEKDR